MRNVVKKQHGFTLLELVVVVAVLGLIASMATEFVAYETNQSRYDLTKDRRANIRTALANYYDDCSEFPDHLEWLVDKTKVDAAGLTECGTTSNENWAGPYILDVDFEAGVAVYRDGWGNSASSALEADFGWRYKPDNGVTPATVELTTLGLDGLVGQVSDAASAEFLFEADEGEGYTLLMAPSSTNFYLISVASGGVNVLSCREGAASTGASTVSMSNCM